MKYESKVWGKTCCIFHQPTCSVHRLEAQAGGFCSRHYHQYRANRFYVESGKIAVNVWRDEQPEPARREVWRGEVFDVPSMVQHQFEVLESGTIWEIYWPDRGGVVDLSDIVRIDEGGMSQPTTSGAGTMPASPRMQPPDPGR